jgi:adhesin transport system outer membrane protein
MLVAGIFTAGPVYAENLKEAVQCMIDTNPEIRSSVYGRLARDEEVRQARAGYYPTFDVEAGAGQSWYDRDYRQEEILDPKKKVPEGEDPEMHWVGKSESDDLTPLEARLSLRQNLFAGMSTWNEVDRQEARVRSGAYNIQVTSEDTALKTVSVYLEVLRRQELVKLSEKNLAVHQRIIKKVSLRNDAGVGSTADLDQIETRLNLAESEVVVSKLNLNETEIRYLALVGHAPADLVKPSVSANLLPDSMDKAEQQAISNRPALKAAQADLESRRKARDIADSPFMPTIDLDAEQTWEDESSAVDEYRDEFKIMVKLRYNLFNGFKDHARKAEASHLISEAREIRNNTHRKVVESVQLSWRSYLAAKARLPYLTQRVTYAKSTANSYNKQWGIGKRTLLDVLNTEAEHISAIKERLNTEYDLLYNQYRVLNGMGQLIDGLGAEYPEASRVDDAEPRNKENMMESSDITIHKIRMYPSFREDNLTIAMAF